MRHIHVKNSNTFTTEPKNDLQILPKVNIVNKENDVPEIIKRFYMIVFYMKIIT